MILQDYFWVVLMNYRTRLRNLREDRDLTQTEVGRLIHKSQQGYNHIEAGRAELKIEDLAILCQFYKVSADYLIGLTDNPTPSKKSPRSLPRSISKKTD